jgi:glycogen(starch) synthase
MAPLVPQPGRVLMTADVVGGVWRYAMTLAVSLCAAGTAVRLLVMGPAPSPGQRAEAAAVSGLSLAEGPFTLEWEPDPWADLARAGAWLRAQAADFRPDVVHLNGYVHAAQPWPCPAIVVGHADVLSWWEAVRGEPAPAEWAAYGEAVRAGLRAADVVVAPTRAMLASLERHYGPLGATAVVPNACGRTLAPAPAKAPLVFAAGRVWDEAQGLATLDAAAPDIRWPVIVAGPEAPPGGRGRRLEHATAAGLLPTAAVARHMRDAAIYCLPARYEPFGLSVLEAAYAGCALVLGDIPSLRETWEGAASFVPPGDAAAVARAVNALIDRPAGRVRMAEAAQARAARFPLARQRDAYLALYRGAWASRAQVRAARRGASAGHRRAQHHEGPSVAGEGARRDRR